MDDSKRVADFDCYASPPPTKFCAREEFVKQNKYPECFLGDPAIDFVMLAKSQGIDGATVHEPSELEAALRRGTEVIAGGEPYILDVRIATVGGGADSTWHQEYKLRR